MAKKKNEIIEDIKTLKQTNPVEYKELKQEFKNALAYQSTDDEDHSHKEDSFEKDNQKIETDLFAEYFEAIDKYGNCGLSIDLQTKNFNEIKEAFNLKSLSDSEMLKKFAFSMCSKDYITTNSIDQNVATTVFGEARDQLELMGEDITDILQSYSFDLS